MKIYNLSNKDDNKKDANTFEIRSVVNKDVEEVHPIYNEVLKIFKHAFAYIDISKIFKNL